MKDRRRILLLLLIAVLFPAALAAREFLIPYTGFSGVPIDSPVYTVLDDNAKGTWGTPDWRGGRYNVPYEDVYNNYKNDGILPVNNYNDWNMVATGGVSAQPVDGDHEDVIITISVTSPAGLNFISLSKPSIVRPYNIQLIMLAHVNGTDCIYNTVTFDLNGGTKVFRLSELARANGVTVDPKDMNMHFDMVLSLPGDTSYVPHKQGTLVHDGNMRLESGAVIPIIEAEDYSSVVNIRMSVRYKEDPNAPESVSELSIPLNGFYKKNSSLVETSETPFSLSIRPLPVCANIDIENQQGALIPIADISFINAQLGGESRQFTIPNMGFFFSSSPNPFEGGLHEPFRLVHDELLSNDPSLLNVRNNIGYTLKVFPGPITFDGTMTVSPSEQYVSAYEGQIVIPEATEKEGINNGRWVKMQEYSGRLFLELESKGLKMMKGRYSSRIYVHVISDGT